MMETYTVDVKISTRCEIKANSPTEAEEIAMKAELDAIGFFDRCNKF